MTEEHSAAVEVDDINDISSSFLAEIESNETYFSTPDRFVVDIEEVA